MKLEVADTQKNLVRDSNTTAVLNQNQKEYEARKLLKMKMKQNQSLEKRINNLEIQMARICTLLEDILEKK